MRILTKLMCAVALISSFRYQVFANYNDDSVEDYKVELLEAEKNWEDLSEEQKQKIILRFAKHLEEVQKKVDHFVDSEKAKAREIKK